MILNYIYILTIVVDAKSHEARRDLDISEILLHPCFNAELDEYNCPPIANNLPSPPKLSWAEQSNYYNKLNRWANYTAAWFCCQMSDLTSNFKANALYHTFTTEICDNEDTMEILNGVDETQLDTAGKYFMDYFLDYCPYEDDHLGFDGFAEIAPRVRSFSYNLFQCAMDEECSPLPQKSTENEPPIYIIAEGANEDCEETRTCYLQHSIIAIGEGPWTVEDHTWISWGPKETDALHSSASGHGLMTPRMGEKWDVSIIKSVSSIVKCTGFHVDKMKLGWTEEKHDSKWDVLKENCVSKIVRVLAAGLKGYVVKPTLFMTPEELNQVLARNEQYECYALDKNEIQSVKKTITQQIKNRYSDDMDL
jgi:hypothetical protein